MAFKIVGLAVDRLSASMDIHIRYGSDNLFYAWANKMKHDEYTTAGGVYTCRELFINSLIGTYRYKEDIDTSLNSDVYISDTYKSLIGIGGCLAERIISEDMFYLILLVCNGKSQSFLSTETYDIMDASLKIINDIASFYKMPKTNANKVGKFMGYISEESWKNNEDKISSYVLEVPKEWVHAPILLYILTLIPRAVWTYGKYINNSVLTLQDLYNVMKEVDETKPRTHGEINLRYIADCMDFTEIVDSRRKLDLLLFNRSRSKNFTTAFENHGVHKALSIGSFSKDKEVSSYWEELRKEWMRNKIENNK